jgi:hypothetical protein
MEGGVAIILLLMLAAGIAVFVFGFSALGGTLSLSRRADSERDASDEQRPAHTRPTTPYHENTKFVGVEDGVRSGDRPDRSE